MISHDSTEIIPGTNDPCLGSWGGSWHTLERWETGMEDGGLVRGRQADARKNGKAGQDADIQGHICPGSSGERSAEGSSRRPEHHAICPGDASGGVAASYSGRSQSHARDAA